MIAEKESTTAVTAVCHTGFENVETTKDAYSTRCHLFLTRVLSKQRRKRMDDARYVDVDDAGGLVLN